MRDRIRDADGDITAAIVRSPWRVLAAEVLFFAAAGGAAYLVGGVDFAGGLMAVGFVVVAATLLVAADRPR